MKLNTKNQRVSVSPSWIRGGPGGVDATLGMHCHSIINAPALRAPPLVLEGEMCISEQFHRGHVRLLLYLLFSFSELAADFDDEPREQQQ